MNVRKWNIIFRALFIMVMVGIFFFFSLCPASGGRPPEDKRHRAKERVITQKWTNSSHIEV